MNILITSVGRRTYMVNYFKKTLEGIGEVHATNSIEIYAMKMADKSVVTPLIHDDNYIEFIFGYCKNNNITAVISLLDIDLPILAKHKRRFTEHGISVIVSDIEFIQTCNDKWLTYKFLIKNQLPTPATFLSIQDTIQAIKSKSIAYPLIIKPRWGMGSIGIYQADNLNELKILYTKTLNNINESYLKYESLQDSENCVIIQEKLVGDEYGLDIFNDLNGKFLTCVPKKKLALRAGETEIAEIIENKCLYRIGEKLSELSMHIGNLDVDLIFVDNKFYILDLNCRFGGQYPFSHLSGVDFPNVLIDLVLNKKINKNNLKAKAGTIGIKDLNPVVFK